MAAVMVWWSVEATAAQERVSTSGNPGNKGVRIYLWKFQIAPAVMLKTVACMAY